MIGRVVLGGVGAAAAGYGFYRLLDLGWDNLLATLIWLAGGVVLHDAVLAPATMAVWALVAALVSRPWRAPAAMGLVVLGTLTLTAIPVLSGLGERPDNPTLLDRDYRSGYLAVLGLILLAVVLARVWGPRRGRRRDAEHATLGR